MTCTEPSPWQATNNSSPRNATVLPVVMVPGARALSGRLVHHSGRPFCHPDRAVVGSLTPAAADIPRRCARRTGRSLLGRTTCSRLVLRIPHVCLLGRSCFRLPHRRGLIDNSAGCFHYDINMLTRNLRDHIPACFRRRHETSSRRLIGPTAVRQRRTCSARPDGHAAEQRPLRAVSHRALRVLSRQNKNYMSFLSQLSFTHKSSELGSTRVVRVR